MYDWKQIQDVEYRIHLARLNAPKDIITKIAVWSVKVTHLSTVILMPLIPITTGLGGCLVAVTFGIFLIVLSIIWWPFLIFILGTSWLWINTWYLRPLLLIPGVLVSFMAIIYVSLAPDHERPSKILKLTLAVEWPFSWYLLKPPAEYYESWNDT